MDAADLLFWLFTLKRANLASFFAASDNGTPNFLALISNLC